MDPDQRRLLKQLVVEDVVEASVVLSLLMGAWVEQLFNSCEHCKFRLNIFVQNQRGLQIPLRSFYNRLQHPITLSDFFQGNHYHMRLQPHHCIFFKESIHAQHF
ncbi:hypothetical protein AAG906_025094 [Vitis piasezkii]